MNSGIRDSECFDYPALADTANENGARQVPLFAMEGMLQTGEPIDAEAANAITVLIDPRPLTRTSISRLLAGGAPVNRRAEDLMVWPVASLNEFLSIYPADGTEVVMVVFNLGALCPIDRTVQEDLGRLREEFPDIPQVLLSDCGNPTHILAALKDGVRGYVPTELEPSMVIQVIRLVLAGGTFIPPGVLEAAGNPGSFGEALESGEDEGSRRPPSELTPRQGEVFELLRQGKSNKLIAYELGMQESTVKVHVRQIMRKLKAINRTHAVFLANSIAKSGVN
jgi:DNA-binding NarL/FixJ family response regulator